MSALDTYAHDHYDPITVIGDYPDEPTHHEEEPVEEPLECFICEKQATVPVCVRYYNPIRNVWMWDELEMICPSCASIEFKIMKKPIPTKVDELINILLSQVTEEQIENDYEINRLYNELMNFSNSWGAQAIYDTDEVCMIVLLDKYVYDYA